MNFPLPGPVRRSDPSAGSGPSEAEEHRIAMAPDMERALGALRDFTRRDILLRFYTDRKPRSVEDVARVAGIHRSVAFDHLERLVALGYLEVGRRRGLPGKPAKIYRLTGGPVQISHPMRRYDVLAEALARTLSASGDGAMLASGRTLGLSMARPGSRSTEGALEPLVEMGGAYHVGGDGRIDCSNCLFAEPCRREPSICEFHAGVIEGLTDRIRDGSRIRALGPNGPGGCTYLEVN